MATIKSGMAANQYYAFATLNETCYMTNGVNRPQAYDGFVVNNMGIRKPSAIATFSANINGSLTQSGSYLYRYTYYNENRGVESDPSDPSATMTAGASSSTDGITINIPVNASVDSQVTHAKVYRTTNNGGIYYYDGNVAFTGTATTYNSTVADSALVTVMGELNASLTANLNVRGLCPSTLALVSRHGRLYAWGAKVYTTGTVTTTNASATVTGSSTAWTDAMVGMYFRVDGDSKKYLIITATATSLTLYENYIGTGGAGQSYFIYGEGSILYYSYTNTSGFPEPESFPSSYWLPVNKDDNDEGTGMIEVHNDLLLAKKNHLYLLSGDNALEFRITPLIATTGCCSHRSMVTDENGNVIFASEKGVYVTNGTEVVSITSDTIQNIFTGEGNPPWSVNKARLEYSHAVYDRLNKRYLLWVAESSSSIEDRCLVYDFNKIDGVPIGWSWFNVQATSSGMLDDSSGTPRIYFGDYYGFVKYFDYTATNDGAQMDSNTRRGTATSATSSTLTQSTATFYTTGSGLTSCWVKILSGTGVGQERRITSNTSTQLTITPNWTVTPSTDSVYAIGYITSYYKTKWFDFDTLFDKLIRRIRAVFKIASSDYSMYEKHYENFSTTAAQTGYFGLSEVDGYHEKNLASNRSRHQQFEFGTSDVDRPFTLNEAEINLALKVATKAKPERSSA